MTRRFCTALVSASLVSFSVVTAQPRSARAEDAPPPIPVPGTPAATTHHTAVIDGKTLRYTATAERITLVDKTEKPAASIFSVSYVLDGRPHATRPVAFLWNGGPGSSTLWLHMGSFAPVRVATNGTGAIVPPSHLVPNDGTLLGATDLVFIDAPGTG